MRHKQCCGAAILATIAAVISGVCHADDATGGKVRFLVGYTFLGLHETFVHSTNPGDSFLPGAFVPGSAGTTTLGSGNFLQLGGGYELLASPSWLVTVDIGGLFGNARNQRQNANDSRPASQGAFIYSKASYGVFLQPQLLYKVGTTNFSVGVSARLAGVYIDNGWFRFNSDETQSASWKLLPKAGPVVRWEFSNTGALEASAQYGTGGASATIAWILKF